MQQQQKNSLRAIPALQSAPQCAILNGLCHLDRFQQRPHGMHPQRCSIPIRTRKKEGPFPQHMTTFVHMLFSAACRPHCLFSKEHFLTLTTILTLDKSCRSTRCLRISPQTLISLSTGRNTWIMPNRSKCGKHLNHFLVAKNMIVIILPSPEKQ